MLVIFIRLHTNGATMDCWSHSTMPACVEVTRSLLPFWFNLCCMGHSCLIGSMPVAWEVPGSNLCCGQVSVFFTKITMIRSFGHGLNTYRSVDSVFCPLRNSKWVWTSWQLLLSVDMEMGECLAYSSLQADWKVKFAAWLMSWQPPGAHLLSLRGPMQCGSAP